jgi:dienelactone hydrolase
LIEFLHGNQQAESHLLAPQYLQDLAERTGTILVAPYGRGAYDFRNAESDVDDAYHAALGAFTIDARKRYLAGYSMGGFSVFRLAPLHPADWSGILSIAGSLLQSTSGPLLSAMPENVRYYIVTGSSDDNVPTLWPTATAIFLRDTGRPVSFYSELNGTHDLFTLQPALSRAWGDMERGVVRAPSGLTGAPNLPDGVKV